MIPELNESGFLPPGIHVATLEEVEARFGASPHRRQLFRGLRAVAEVLRHAGCPALYLDGSFATGKDLPNDFDGCWDMYGVDPGLLDPTLLDFRNSRAAQKLHFGGELFPASSNEAGSGKTFLEFFQTDKDTGAAKGIVKIELQRVQ